MIRLAIYNDNSTNPGTKLAETGEISVTGAGTWHGSIPDTVLPAGTYWLAEIQSNTAYLWAFNSSGLTRFETWTYGVMPVTANTSCCGTSSGSVALDAGYCGFSPATPSFTVSSTSSATPTAPGRFTATPTATPSMTSSSSASPTPSFTISPTFSALPTPGCQDLVGSLGNNTSFAFAPSYVVYTAYTAAATGYLTYMQIQAVGPGTAALAIYSDNVGAPGTLLSQTGVISAPSAGTYQANLAPVPVTAGTAYWLAMATSGSGFAVAMSNPSSNTSVYQNISGFPATANATRGLPLYGMAIDAISCPMSPTVSPTQTPSFSASPTAPGTFTDSPTVTVSFSFSPTATVSPTRTPTPYGCSPLMGDLTASYVSNGANYVSYSNFNLSSAATINYMEVAYLSGASTHARMGLYSNSGGYPSTKLAESADFIVSGGGTWHASIPDTALAAGTYWLAVIQSTNTAYVFDHTSSAYIMTESWPYGPLPASVGSSNIGGIEGSASMSLQAGYCSFVPPTATPSASPSFTASPTNSPFFSPTATPSITATPTNSPVFSPTLTPTISPSSTLTPFVSGCLATFGDLSGGGFGTLPAYDAFFSPYAVAGSGQVNYIDYELNGAYAGTIQLAVYSDNSGVPGSLLGHSGSISLPSAGTFRAFLGSTVPVSTGTYWLAVIGTASSLGDVLNSNSNHVIYEQFGVSSFPASATSSLDSSSLRLSMSAGYCFATPTPSPSPTPSITANGTFTATPTGTPSASPSASPTNSPSGTFSASPTATPSASPTASPSATPSASPTASSSGTRAPSPTASPTATPSANPDGLAQPQPQLHGLPPVSPTVTVTATPNSCAALMGDFTQFSTGNTPNYIFYSSYTLASAATLNYMEVQYQAGTTTARVAIYSDSSGSPSAKLAESGDINVTGGGTWHASIPDTALAAGTYWLAVIQSSNTAALWIHNSAGTIKFQNWSYGTLPSGAAPTSIQSSSGRQCRGQVTAISAC